MVIETAEVLTARLSPYAQGDPEKPPRELRRLFQRDLVTPNGLLKVPAASFLRRAAEGLGLPRSLPDGLRTGLPELAHQAQVVRQRLAEVEGFAPKVLGEVQEARRHLEAADVADEKMRRAAFERLDAVSDTLSGLQTLVADYKALADTEGRAIERALRLLTR